MKSFESDDELDRALFALPLEEPPAGLRTAILNATVYRAPSPFKLWEAWLIGAGAAVIVWIIGLIVAGGSERAMAASDLIANSLVAFFSQPSTIVWLAIGAATALWLSQSNLTLLSLPQNRKNR